MKCLRLLFISGLLSHVATGILLTSYDCAPTPEKFHLANEILNCRHYNINLIIPATHFEEYYWLEITYFIDIQEKTQIIKLHYMLQTEIEENATILRSSQMYRWYPKFYRYCVKSQILSIYFETFFNPGNYTLDMKIRSRLTADNVPGFSKMMYLDKKGDQTTLFTTNFIWNARSVFPCWDEPSSSATFNISVRHLRSYTALSNMPMREQTEENVYGLDFVWTHFHTTPLIPVYLVGIVVFNNLISISNDNKSVNIWARPEVIGKLEAVRDVIKVYSRYISKTLKFTSEMPKMDHVVIPSSSLMGKSKFGLYTYKETDLVDNEIMAWHVAHKLAHHWLGNYGGPVWWTDIWINEGLAKFLGIYITDKVYKDLRVMDRFVIHEQQLALSEDIQSRVNPIMQIFYNITEIDKAFSIITLNKETALIRMLYHTMPDINFWAAICTHMKIQYSSINSTYFLRDFPKPIHLWRSFEAMLPKLLLNWDVETMMRNWFEAPNYPFVQVNYIRENNTIRYYQNHLYVPANKNTSLWWIPISYNTQSNFNKTMPILWLSPEDKQRFITKINNVPNGWVIFNLQQTGYYRVNYDMENWRSLINYLNKDNYTKIHPINRAQLIDDSYHLMMADHLDSTIFLNLSRYLRREKDYIPWYPMKRILSNMTIFFQFPEGASIKKYMARILNDTLDDIGFEENTNDSHFTKQLRLLVLELACKLGNPKCLKMANAKLGAFLEDTNKNVILPAWRNWTLCMGMKTFVPELWLKMINEYRRTKNFEYLESLNCIQKPIIIIIYINMLILNELPVEGEHRPQIIQKIIEKHASDDTVLKYLTLNYDWIKTFISVPLINVLRINVYKLKHFIQLLDFVSYHKFDGNLEEMGKTTKDYFAYNIAKQSNQVQNEVKMFVKKFNISLKNNASE